MPNKLFHLEKIHILNFRSIENVTLHNLGGITILVGPNGSGKTNILKAIYWSFKDTMLSISDVPVRLRGRRRKRSLISSSLLKIINQKQLNTLFFESLNNRYKEVLNRSIRPKKCLDRVKYLKMNKYSDGTREFISFDDSFTCLDYELQNTIKTLLENSSITLRPSFFTQKIQNIFYMGIETYLLKKKTYTTNINHEDLTKIIQSSYQLNELLNELSKHMYDLFTKHETENDTNPVYDLKAIEKDWKEHISSIQKTQAPMEIPIYVMGDQTTLPLKELFKIIKKPLTNVLNLVDEKEMLKSFWKEVVPNVVLLSEEMEFPDEIIKNKTWGDTIKDNEKTAICYRLFSIYDIDLDNFDNNSIGSQSQILNNLLIDFSKELQSNWKQEKVKLQCNIAESSISFSIYDLDENNVELQSNAPSLRSRGFKWFLSYFITLKYMKKRGNSILLLDDPAVFLHENGQKDFIKSIEDVSTTNQIFYTTHLISLFDENKLERVLLVEQDKLKNTRIQKPWSSTNKQVIFPVYYSLGFDRLIFSKNDKILFVEGISDKFILEGLQKHTAFLKDYYIHPISGGCKLDDNEIIREIEILRCINRYKNTIKHIFILDGDRMQIFNKKPEVINNKVIYLGNEEQEIEDLIDKTFYLKTVEAYYTTVFAENKEKLGKLQEIIKELNESSEVTKISKMLQCRFEKEGLGNFSKVGVAIMLKRIIVNKRKTVIKKFQKIIDILEKELK